LHSQDFFDHPALPVRKLRLIPNQILIINLTA